MKTLLKISCLLTILSVSSLGYSINCNDVFSFKADRKDLSGSSTVMQFEGEGFVYQHNISSDIIVVQNSGTDPNVQNFRAVFNVIDTNQNNTSFQVALANESDAFAKQNLSSVNQIKINSGGMIFRALEIILVHNPAMTQQDQAFANQARANENRLTPQVLEKKIRVAKSLIDEMSAMDPHSIDKNDLADWRYNLMKYMGGKIVVSWSDIPVGEIQVAGSTLPRMKNWQAAFVRNGFSDISNSIQSLINLVNIN